MQSETMRTAGVVDAPEPGRGMPVVKLGLRIALASAAIAALSLNARSRVELAAASQPEAAFVPSTPPASAPAPAPAQAARLGLAAPGTDPFERTAARVDARTGSREDTLMRGDVRTVEASALRVTLTRGGPAGPIPNLFVVMARRAADGPAMDRPALAVVRTGARNVIATKFGAVETLDLTLGGETRRTCTGFVTREARFRIDGWLCAPRGLPPDTRVLGCTIDALSLVDLGDPEAMAAFSAAAGPDQICNPSARVADTAARTGSIGRRGQIKK